MVEIGDTISDEILFQFLETSFENSKQYLKDAKTILNSSPGHSYAMCVLSLEELTKAHHFLAFAMEKTPLVIDENLMDIFTQLRRNHEYKQSFQKTDTELAIYVYLIKKKFGLKILKKNEMLKQLIKISENKKIRKIIGKLMEKELEFYNKMQIKKETGMYVDFEAGPKDITKNRTKKFIRHVENKIQRFERYFFKTKIYKNFSNQPKIR